MCAPDLMASRRRASLRPSLREGLRSLGFLGRRPVSRSAPTPQLSLPAKLGGFFSDELTRECTRPMPVANRYRVESRPHGLARFEGSNRVS